LFLILLLAIVVVFLFKAKNLGKGIAVVDLGVLLDGRIYDIITTKFLSLDLIVPSFVIDDLKNISKSSDNVKRSRSKRALAIVDQLQKSNVVHTKIVKLNLDKSDDDSLKIITLAKNAKIKIITNNFDLYKKASLQGITVLNINDLEAALYPIFLPGEKVTVYLVKEGAQHQQAVGYFDDKTMIVAEDGKNFIGKNVTLTITSSMFTSTGKVIFGKIS
jgi:uncharacterized protein YacL